MTRRMVAVWPLIADRICTISSCHLTALERHLAVSLRPPFGSLGISSKEYTYGMMAGRTTRSSHALLAIAATLTLPACSVLFDATGNQAVNDASIDADAELSEAALRGNFVELNFNLSSARDTSPRSLPIDEVNVDYGEGVYGNALYSYTFLNNPHLVLGGSETFPSENYTVEMWIWRVGFHEMLLWGDDPTGGYPVNQFLLPETSDVQSGLRLMSSNDCMTFYLVGAGDQRPSREIWTHVALTKTATTLRFYLDGELAVMGELTGNRCQENRTWHVGGTSSGQYFEGRLDEFKLSDYAKTEQEIQASMCFDSETETLDEACLMGFP